MTTPYRYAYLRAVMMPGKAIPLVHIIDDWNAAVCRPQVRALKWDVIRDRWDIKRFTPSGFGVGGVSGQTRPAKEAYGAQEASGHVSF